MFESAIIGMEQGSWGKGTGGAFAFCSRPDAVSVASYKVDFLGDMRFSGQKPSDLRYFA